MSSTIQCKHFIRLTNLILNKQWLNSMKENKKKKETRDRKNNNIFFLSIQCEKKQQSSID